MPEAIGYGTNSYWLEKEIDDYGMNFDRHTADWAMRDPPIRSKEGSSRPKRLGMKMPRFISLPSVGRRKKECCREAWTHDLYATETRDSDPKKSIERCGEYY